MKMPGQVLAHSLPAGGTSTMRCTMNRSDNNIAGSVKASFCPPGADTVLFDLERQFRTMQAEHHSRPDPTDEEVEANVDALIPIYCQMAAIIPQTQAGAIAQLRLFQEWELIGREPDEIRMFLTALTGLEGIESASVRAAAFASALVEMDTAAAAELPAEPTEVMIQAAIECCGVTVDLARCVWTTMRGAMQGAALEAVA
jgi:hypothetical protein